MAWFPAKDVSWWLGNSVPVAMRYYAMATEASFLEACDSKGQTVRHRQDAAGVVFRCEKNRARALILRVYRYSE